MIKNSNELMSAQNSNTRDHSVMILLPDKQQQHLIIKL